MKILEHERKMEKRSSNIRLNCVDREFNNVERMKKLNNIRNGSILVGQIGLLE